MSEIDEIIESGMVFRGAPKPKVDDGKVKTKAKKKKYITGAHGSGSAKQKGEIPSATCQSQQVSHI